MQPVAIRHRTRPAPVSVNERLQADTVGHCCLTFMGIDPSLSATGVAVLSAWQIKTFLLTAETIVPGG